MCGMRVARANLVWLGVGLIAGLILAGAMGVVVVQLMIPWEDVCAVLVPAQKLMESGSSLLTQLQDWLTQAEEFLVSMGDGEEVGEAKTGLAGLLDKAKGITGDIRDIVVDVVTLPLQALIDLARVVLNEVEASVDAAQKTISSIDVSRCN